MCPAAEPTSGDACDVGSMRCAYDGTQCSCFGGGGGGGAQWLCFPAGAADGGGTGACPTTPPSAGDACTALGQFCNFGNNQVCSCNAQTQQWLCNF